MDFLAVGQITRLCHGSQLVASGKVKKESTNGLRLLQGGATTRTSSVIFLASACLLKLAFSKSRVQMSSCKTHRRAAAVRAPPDVTEEESLVCSFGVIADVQYVDMEDGYNFTRTRVRRYRQSLRLWKEAVQWFHASKVDFIAQLGDILDGANCDVEGGNVAALQDVYSVISKKSPPLLNLIGNHELYNFSREELEEGVPVEGLEVLFRSSADPRLGSKDAPASSYYSFSPHPSWRFIVLDPYDVSILTSGGGRPGKELGKQDLCQEAVEMCQANNPNDILKDGFAQGLTPGPDMRWVPLNGGIGKAQLEWLRGALRCAYDAGQQTVVFSHVVLHPDGTPQGDSHCLTLLWNYKEVLTCLQQAASPPVAVFCGHTHKTAHIMDEVSGTHHVTLASPLEVPPESDACGIVDAFADGTLTLRGRGQVPTLHLQRGVAVQSA